MPSANCVVCGVPLTGFAAIFLGWRGIGRSPRNPNACTSCNAHLEEGRLIEITVLFADLSSFTEMTGRLGAAAAHSVVDEFLRLAASTLTSQGAFIDKFIGDAVMAFFNIPIKREDHAAAAVAAAVRLQELMPGLSKKTGVPLKASIGISSGYARVGRLGSDDIKDYTAIGDAVNEAARLQAQARAAEIVVSRAVYREVAAAYPDAKPETLVLKGFSQPAVAYRLNGDPLTAFDASKWLEGRPVMSWSSVLFAVLGSGCLGKDFAASLVLVFGAGSASSLAALSRLLDSSPLRLPLLAATAAFSLTVLGSLERQRRQRRDCVARRSCLEMTRGEKRGAYFAAGSAALALALVAFELWQHYVLGHTLVGR